MEGEDDKVMKKDVDRKNKKAKEKNDRKMVKRSGGKCEKCKIGFKIGHLQLQCADCKCSFHLACTEISMQQHEAFEKVSGISWTCIQCRGEIEDVEVEECENEESEDKNVEDDEVEDKEQEEEKCKVCKDICTENALQCDMCDFWHHIDCEGISKTAYKVLGSFIWFCQDCTIKYKKQKEFKEVNLFDIKTLKQEIVDEIRKVIPGLVSDELNKFGKNNQDSSKQVHEAQKIKNPSTKHSITFQPINKNAEETTYTKKTFSEMLKSGLPEKMKHVPINKTLLTKNGKGYMVFPDKQSRDLAADAMKNECNVQVQEKENKLIYPKVKVCGISKEFIKKEDIDELRKEILKKNTLVRDIVGNDNDKFKILFTNDDIDSDYFSAIIKVDPKIKEVIQINGNKIYIGFSACKVYDRHHIVQCYKCQEFGHKKGSDRCTLKNSDKCICLYCGGNHMSKECSTKSSESDMFKKYKCFNCSVSKDEDIRNRCNGHTTNSYHCPILQNELKKLLKRTMGSTNQENVSKNSIVT